MKRKKPGKTVSLLMVLLIYILAFLVGFWGVMELKIPSPLWQMAYANLMAAVVIYFFSKFMDNSSLFTPFWSIAPILTAFYWLLPNLFMKTISFYQWVGIALILFWGLRLTLHWMLRWEGFRQEDWRFQALRKQTRHWYWTFSLVAIHLLPSALVFLATLPLYFVFERPPTVPVTGIWVVAVFIMVLGVGLETVADFQLLKFNGNTSNRNKLLRSGVWAKLSHPNYVGEMLFWWGIYLYAISFYLPLWRLFLGPTLITFTFYFILIPWMDKHLENRKNDGK